MRLSSLAEALIALSAKAARVACTMRSERALFELLVEEKTGDSKNKRFVQDFKTLGDVLVQEVVRHEITQRFAGLSDHIYGEENNSFTNKLGETLTVTIQPSQQQTCDLLATVLDGNTEAARLLAEVVHTEVGGETHPELENVREDVDADDLGIWIDPIDSTAQYIHGSDGGEVGQGVHAEGLQCVVIIIGVYQRSTGCPVLGVCHQPFYSHDTDTDRWQGRCVWGVAYGATRVVSVPCCGPGGEVENCVVTSSSESGEVQEKLATRYAVRHAAGAGYKVLCVIDGRAVGYVLTSGSTFKWDTCGPHAILRALGGDVLSLSDTRDKLKDVTTHSDEGDVAKMAATCRLKYSSPDPGDRPAGEKWSNAGGIVAYTDVEHLVGVLQTLQ